MEIDKSIKVGDIVATNASNIRPYIGQRVFGEVSRINFTGIHKGFLVALNLNGKLFNNYTSMNVCPFNEPGRPYEDAYLVKATPEECEAHRTGVMPSKEDLWCIQVTEGNIDLLNEYMQPLLEKYCKPNTWEITKSTLGSYFTCPDKWTGQHSYQAPLSETKLITTEEFIEKTGMKKKSEFKYKKGVWYKIEKRDSFGKCNKDSNDNIPYDECIVEKQYEIHNGLVAHLDGIEADMNEVSKYLPDGHPDKVRPHSFEGRYLKCLNDRGKKHYPCHTGDYLKFVAEKNGIQYWGAYNSKCQSDGTDNPRYFASNVHENKYFELMPVGFEPDSERSLKASEAFHDFQIGQKFKMLVDNPHSAGLNKGDIEPYYKGGGIVEQIEGSKKKDDSPFERFEYSFKFHDLVEEPKIVIPRKDTFDPIVKAPIVI